jgi:hypothetical protein
LHVCRDAGSGTVAEHVLQWELPEYPRSISGEELTRFIHISNVEDKFAIEGRGVVIAPGLPRAKAGLLKHGDPIILFDDDEAALITNVKAIELSSPPSVIGPGNSAPKRYPARGH